MKKLDSNDHNLIFFNCKNNISKWTIMKLAQKLLGVRYNHYYPHPYCNIHKANKDEDLVHN